MLIDHSVDLTESYIEDLGRSIPFLKRIFPDSVVILFVEGFVKFHIYQVEARPLALLTHNLTAVYINHSGCLM